MRVVAIILALAAGASGCSCSSNETEEQCTTTCTGEPCMWQDPCEGTKRRNLRFGAAATGCCTYPDCCLDPTNAWCTRRLTAEETDALSAEERQERRRLC